MKKRVLTAVLIGLPWLACAVTPMDAPLPEDKISLVECEYRKDEAELREKFEIEIESGTYHYRVYVPSGYSSSGERRYPCLFVTFPSGDAEINGVRAYARSKRWFVVMHVEAGEGYPKQGIANFLAAHDDVVQRFRIMEGRKIVTGVARGAALASQALGLRDGISGVILQSGDFAEFEPPTQSRWGYRRRALNEDRSLSVYGLFGKEDGSRVYITPLEVSLPLHTERKLVEFAGQTVEAPPAEMALALDWIETQYLYKGRSAPAAEGIMRQRVEALSGANAAERRKACGEYLRLIEQCALVDEPAMQELVARLRAETPETPAVAKSEITTYFDAVDENTPIPTRLFMQIFSPVPGKHAAKAGVKDGDILMGVDGCRIRDLQDFEANKLFHERRPDIALTIASAGKTRTVVLKDLAPVRLCGFGIRDMLYPSIILAFKEWGLSAKSILGQDFSSVHVSDKGIETSDPEGSEPGASWAQPNVAVARLPARAREAIFKLIESGKKEQREWATGILTVFGHLLYERYAEAAELIVSRRLLESNYDPFLHRLLEFYRDLALHPVSVEGGIPLDTYRVDALYFAMCYPFPIRPYKRVDGFADKKLQDLFDKATSSLALFSDELCDGAMEYVNEEDADVDQYVSQVKGALVDQRHHGGWPFRSPLIRDSAARRKVIAELVRRQANPSSRTLENAFTLLAPLLRENGASVQTFAEAYRMIAETGPREMATANTIIRDTIENQWLSRPEMEEARRRVEQSCLKVAPIYELLAGVDTEFQRRSMRGYYFRYGMLVQDLATYCQDDAFRAYIARAVVRACH